jgi:hypothetical protein
MTARPTYLRNSDWVVTAFGYWPAFHDSQVSDFRYTQDGSGSIEFVVHGWEMTRDVDDRGYFRLIKHHLVRFRFQDIADAALEAFGVANVLFQLDFSRADEMSRDGLFTVTLDSAMGSDRGGHFRARIGEVLEVMPCNADGGVGDE